MPRANCSSSRHVGGNGGPEALELVELPLPEVRRDEVLIQVFAAGVNRPDILQRQAIYPPPPGAERTSMFDATINE